jgi:hypothetical protein
MQTASVVLGTESGIVALTESGGTWQRAATYLDGVNVVALARRGQDAVLAATERDGLFRVDLYSGEAAPLGAGIVPKKLHALTVSPHDANKIYVGAEPAGVFISDDGGATWRENASVRAIAAERKWLYPVPTVANHIRHIVVSWDDPRHVLAAVQVGGILRSEDGGETWTEVTEGFDPDVHSFLQHPQKPEIVYAVAGGGGPVHTVGDYSSYGAPLPMGRPFYRSTDRGKTWECVSVDFERHYGIGMGAVATGSATLIGPVARDAPPFWGGRPGVGADAVIMISKDDGTSWKQCTDGLPPRFTTMVEAIEVDRTRNQIFIGTGRDRMKEAGGGSGEVYVCNDVDGRWSRVPVEVPGVSAIVAV